MPHLTRRRFTLFGIAAGAAVSVLRQAPALGQGAGSARITRGAVFHDPVIPVQGNPTGDVTIIEFFDYQCPYCRAVHPDLMQVVEEDGNIRLIMKDWPIFGDISSYAARLVLATQYQDRYAGAQQALMEAKGQLDKARIDQLLGEVGVDVAHARRDLGQHAGEIEAALDRTDMQSQAFGFAGTPSFIVDDFMYRGAVGQDVLRQAVGRSRAGRSDN